MSNEIITVFESSILVDKELDLRTYFNESLLNHVIQYYGEDEVELNDFGLDSERVKYRVIIEKI